MSSSIGDVWRREVLAGLGTASLSAITGCLSAGGDSGSISVNVRSEDTETRSSAGTEAAQRLLNAGVPGVCGTASSGVNVPVSKGTLAANQVVGCSPSSTALSVTNLDDDDYIFRTAPSDLLQGRVDAQVMSERLGVDTAATLYVDNDYGQQLSNRFTEVFEDEFGGTVTGQNGYPQGGSSYASVVESALGGDVGGLFIIGYPEDGQQLFRDYYSASGGGEAILVPDALQDPALPGQVGNEMANVTGTAPAAGGPAEEAFSSAFQERYDRPPGAFASQSYDSAAVLMLANAAAGENDGTAVRDQMRNVANPGGTTVTPENLVEGIELAASGQEINYQGASSDVNFNEAGDPANAAYQVWNFAGQGADSVDIAETLTSEGDNPSGAGPSADEIPGGTDRTIELGILLPASGNLASIGEDMIAAGQMAAAEVNEGF